MATTQDFLTGSNVVRETASISFDDKNGPEWWVCHADGQVEHFDTASAALKAVKGRAKKLVDTTRTSGVILTTVQWLNVPAGFKPPNGA